MPTHRRTGAQDFGARTRRPRRMSLVPCGLWLHAWSHAYAFTCLLWCSAWPSRWRLRRKTPSLQRRWGHRVHRHRFSQPAGGIDTCARSQGGWAGGGAYQQPVSMQALRATAHAHAVHDLHRLCCVLLVLPDVLLISYRLSSVSTLEVCNPTEQ